jgi:hypothetical protein
VLEWFRQLSTIPKVVVVGLAVGLVLLVLLVWLEFLAFLSPVAGIIFGLLFGVSIIALIIRVAQRRSVRNWAIVAVASVVLMVTFGGISDIVYGGDESPSSGQGGSGEKANYTPSNGGGASTSPSSWRNLFDKDADFNQSYEEAEGYLRAAQVNVPEHEVPAAAVATCRILTFVKETGADLPLVEAQVDTAYNEMGAADYVRAADLGGLPQYGQKCDRVWVLNRMYQKASW